MRVFLVIIGFVVALCKPLLGQNDIKPEKEELAKISRELDNPLAKRWSLVFQENLAVNTGSIIANPLMSNTFFFQPALPIPAGENLVFTARPVFPLVTAPVFYEDGSISHLTGFGDIQMVTLLGPGKASGVVWGGGATFVFPTATKNELGNGKYQLGPSFMMFDINKRWTKGIFIQHWWSFGGDKNRDKISKTDLQYVLRRNLGTVSLGLGPTISVNWKKEIENAITLPIGFGITKTLRIGKTPVKLRFEPQYSVIKPKDFGTCWNFRLQIAPVIGSPFFNE